MHKYRNVSCTFLGFSTNFPKLFQHLWGSSLLSSAIIKTKSCVPASSQYSFIEKSYISTFLNIQRANSLITGITDNIGFNFLWGSFQPDDDYQALSRKPERRGLACSLSPGEGEMAGWFCRRWWKRQKAALLEWHSQFATLKTTSGYCLNLWGRKKLMKET